MHRREEKLKNMKWGRERERKMYEEMGGTNLFTQNQLHSIIPFILHVPKNSICVVQKREERSTSYLCIVKAPS